MSQDPLRIIDLLEIRCALSQPPEIDNSDNVVRLKSIEKSCLRENNEVEILSESIKVLPNRTDRASGLLDHDSHDKIPTKK
ncbi:unnamed protein product [Dovyalis caffra]|uniref:Uncharacterized protein n=1 Tax=Dovyalis caffra TaxID=77055 RepID=A0AAV1R6M8_9ROSI|nr:unnamed protein product [Dovyalis caffra]